MKPATDESYETVICNLCNGAGCRKCDGDGHLYVDKNGVLLPEHEPEFNAEDRDEND